MTDLEKTATELAAANGADAVWIITLKRIGNDDVEVLIGSSASGGMLMMLPIAIKEAADRMAANLMTGKNVTELHEA